MRRTPLKRHGPKYFAWKRFRDSYAEECRGEDGLIECGDGSREEEPDLHHIEGREARPDLYFAKENLVWLNRNHHEGVHNGTKDIHGNSIDND